MSFTTQIFIFTFFPISFLLYYLVYILQTKSSLSSFLKKIRALDCLTILLGSVFYAWACFNDVFKLILYVLLVYVLGYLIQKYKNCSVKVTTEKDGTLNESKVSVALLILIVSIAAFLVVFVFYKFFHIVLNAFDDGVSVKALIAPLGLSFITFSAISYVVDIYKGKAKSGSFIDCALYLTFFPKIISGPIVLWQDFSEQTGSREINLTLISGGILRIMIGFAKKVILADYFGSVIASMPQAIDVPTAFLSGLLYMLQIYYDFSGYSDIAIGISNMMGYSFKENFNFPYLSCSISEFWRRWHISLGTWFKEYVYIPLGGSRKGLKRTIINTLIVFTLTGLWHGIGKNFLIWGILNGLFIVFEKSFIKSKPNKRYLHILQWLVTMIIVYFCWQIFRFNYVSNFVVWFKTLLGISGYGTIQYTWQYFYSAKLITMVIIGILGATLWGLPKIRVLYNKILLTKVGFLINAVIFILLFVLALLSLVSSTYSPFLYAQY